MAKLRCKSCLQELPDGHQGQCPFCGECHQIRSFYARDDLKINLLEKVKEISKLKYNYLFKPRVFTVLILLAIISPLVGKFSNDLMIGGLIGYFLSLAGLILGRSMAIEREELTKIIYK